MCLPEWARFSNAALPHGILDDIARQEELRSLRQLAIDAPEVHWDRLLFSAKESELQATVYDLEIVVSLPDLTVIFCAKNSARLKGACRVLIGCLQLNVPPWCLHPADCDGRTGDPAPVT